ncbi:HsdM family class I SAM-dependent methyltransferase [Sulfurimonas sp.]
MNKEILDYLKEYGSNEAFINSLIVSAFLVKKNIQNVKNKKIKNLMIKKDELEYSSLLEFIDIISINNKNFCFEELLELFEFVISPSDKLINGAIYTPKRIRNYITKEVFSNLKNTSFNKMTVVDIACGCGGFLIDASVEIKERTGKSYKKIFQENIYGIDIQQYSVERTEILLALLAISKNEDAEKFYFNIYQGDSLEYSWKETKFDVILGNPPYVCSRNMDNKTKELMKNWSTCKTGHPDLYIPFFQIGYELLDKHGILGYITVNSFFNSVNGRAIRSYFEENNVKLSIVDFGDEQIFNSRMTYTCLCFIQKSHNGHISYIQKKSNVLQPLKKIKFIEEYYQDLDALQGWNLKDNNFVKRMESRGIPFEKVYDTKSGIATLKNHIYIFKSVKDDDKYFYIDEDTPIEKNICKNILNSNKLAKYDNIDDLLEKIIFPYVYDANNQAILIEETKFQNLYPKTYNYLLENKKLLATRDKGNGKYLAWYAYGRNQSLEKRKEKLFFPQLVKKGFKTFYSEDENLYFYNGMCAYASKKDLLKLKKIMKTDYFWKYVESKAKHYSSGYFGLGKNYLKKFGII